MAKVKRASTLSGLVDSDVEDMMFHELPTPDSAAENRAPAKKTRGRPKVAPSKVTKTKAPARRTSGRLAATAKSTNVVPVKGKRKALADKTNQQDDGETEEADDFEQDVVMEDAEVEEQVQVKKATTKPAKKAAVPRRNAAKGKRLSVDDSQAVPQPAPRAKKGRPARKEITEEASPEKVIQETQQDVMDLDGEVDEEVEASVIEQSVARIAHNSRQTSHSRPQQFIPRQRTRSASDTERADPNLRRKLGELTKKYENLQLKHQDLREIGLKEAERNYETLRRQSEDKTKKYNDLIASMKTDLVTQTSLAKESRGLRKKLETQASEMAALQLKVEEITASLSEAQAQNKTLSAKLAANRTVAASVESANAPKIPGSAMKAGIRMIGSAEAAQAAQHAQLKEDLYSDLTGLLVRKRVDRKTEEDIFDCLQTGRNGTLHFKLAAANEKSSESYDDAQCNYVPQLDPSRDKALIELLPDYLVDEITFPRQHAAKFYARVVKALTEKPA